MAYFSFTNLQGVATSTMWMRMDVKLTRILVFIIGEGYLEEEAIEVHIIYLCLTFTLHIGLFI